MLCWYVLELCPIECLLTPSVNLHYAILQIWKGVWQGNDIVAKILNLRECTIRNSRDFKEEFPRLR